jgi:hypothetical protein
VSALYEARLRPGVEPGATIGQAAVGWRPVGGDAIEEDTVAVVAGDPAAAPDPQVELVAAAADLARLLKGTPPYAGRADEGAAWQDLATRVDTLARQDVAGAEELAELVAQAREAG